MINVISQIATHEQGLRWFVYNDSIKLSGPFRTKEEAYADARVHESRQGRKPYSDPKGGPEFDAP